MVYIIRDIGTNVTLCYVGLILAYKKLEQDY